MAKYESWEDLATKMSWEGGLMEFLTGYGFNLDDMPDDIDPDIATALTNIINAMGSVADDIDFVEDAAAEYAV